MSVLPRFSKNIVVLHPDADSRDYEIMRKEKLRRRNNPQGYQSNYKKFNPTDEERRKVYEYAYAHVNVKDIAIMMGVSYQTLYNACSEEIKRARIQSNYDVTKAQIKRALNTSDPRTASVNQAAAQFLLKTKAGFKETTVQEIIDSSEPKRLIVQFNDPDEIDPHDESKMIDITPE